MQEICCQKIAVVTVQQLDWQNVAVLLADDHD